MHSEQIDKIAEALSKAQGQIRNPEKNKTVEIKPKNGTPPYSFMYADLPECYDAARKSLTDNSICHFSYVQYISGSPFLFMKLVHSSGQWLMSCIILPTRVSAKELAADLTYFRRYLFCALVGIAAEEDKDHVPEAGAQYGDKKVVPPMQKPPQPIRPPQTQQQVRPPIKPPVEQPLPTTHGQSVPEWMREADEAEAEMRRK